MDASTNYYDASAGYQSVSIINDDIRFNVLSEQIAITSALNAITSAQSVIMTALTVVTSVIKIMSSALNNASATLMTSTNNTKQNSLKDAKV